MLDDTRYRIPDAGCRMPDAGYWISGIAIHIVPILLLFIEYRESSCEYHVAIAPGSELIAGQQQATSSQ